jgi:hypothetical protein
VGGLLDVKSLKSYCRFLALSFKYAFRAIFYGVCDKGADILAHLFRSSSREFVRGTIQVTDNPVRESLAGSTSLAAVAFLSHG